MQKVLHILLLCSKIYSCDTTLVIKRGRLKMKILIICSKAFYKDIAPIKERLE